MLMTKMRQSNQRGDTIVEVLIAVAIVSLVLTSAYALTSRNVRANQEVQEQAYAQKLVEQQAELFRSSAVPPDGGCFNTVGAPVATGSGCVVNNGGASYKLSINSQSIPNVYRIRASWATLGATTATVTVYYEVVAT
jgi:prepilin-type N-terminal cleavage/methylation domain-containing protein